LKRVVLLGLVAMAAWCAVALAASPPPKILSARYGWFKPEGAPKGYHAIRIRARDPDGQIVSMRYSLRPSNRGAIADGGCGLGGKKTGDAETWYLPMRKLEPGRYVITALAESSDCATDAPLQTSRERRFRFGVR
jgi:hypothetical protein